LRFLSSTLSCWAAEFWTSGGSGGYAPTPYVLELIRLPHFTPAYIHFHGQRLQKENRFSTGLLLTVLR